MSAITRPSVSIWIVVALLATSLSAQNLIKNGEFDTDLAFWTPLSSTPPSNATHSSLGFDGDFAAQKGSVLLYEAREGFNNFVDIRQCVSPAALPDGLQFRAYAWAASLYGNGAGIDAEVILWDYDGAGCTGNLLREHRQALPARSIIKDLHPQGPQGRARWGQLWFSYPPPAGTKSVRVVLELVKRFPVGTATGGFDDVFLGTALPAEPCPRFDTNEGVIDNNCLHFNQFNVTAAWKTADGDHGTGTAIPLSEDSGAFWFFDSNNPEMIVKIINACGFNDRYWVFAGGLTNVAVTLTVTDTHSGKTKIYNNPLNTTFTPFQDTNAFATCP